MNIFSFDFDRKSVVIHLKCVCALCGEFLELETNCPGLCEDPSDPDDGRSLRQLREMFLHGDASSGSVSSPEWDVRGSAWSDDTDRDERSRLNN